jgi:hypothetical protein
MLAVGEYESSSNTFFCLCPPATIRDLNADMKDEIYMRIDKDIVKYLVQLEMADDRHINSDGSVIVKLNKALYGTKQAGRSWYDKLCDDIKQIGYEQNKSELGIFMKNKVGIISNIVIYVDDIIVMSRDDEEHEIVINHLKRCYEKINVSANRSYKFDFLGMNFEIVDKFVYVNMIGYINKVLSDQQIQKDSNTPYTNNLFENRKLNLLDEKGQYRIRSMIAKLLYLAKRTRSDILLPIIALSTRVEKYNMDDEHKLMKILQYIKMTKELKLKLYDESEDNIIKLKCYCDASHGIHEDGKGHSAYAFTIGTGFFLVKSNKQKMIAKSSTEAEIIAMNEASSESLYIMQVIRDSGFKVDRCIIKEDNLSAIAIVNGGIEVMKKTKHMRIRTLYVKERIDNGEIDIEHCSTKDMIVDILTKPVVGKNFGILRDKLLGQQRSDDV